jgi:hypothetical protein
MAARLPNLPCSFWPVQSGATIRLIAAASRATIAFDHEV